MEKYTTRIRDGYYFTVLLTVLLFGWALAPPAQGQVDVTLPSGVVGLEGAGASITVDIGDLSSATTGVSSFKIEITYDTTIVDITGVSLPSQTSGWSIATNPDDPSSEKSEQIIVAAASSDTLSTSNAPILNLDLVFQEDVPTGTSFTLTVANVTLNEGSPGSNGVNGGGEAGSYGDVTGESGATNADASEVLKFTVGNSSALDLGGIYLEAGDVTANGSATAYDASYILQRSVDPDLCFPAEENAGLCTVGAKRMEAFRAGQLAWGASRVQADGSIELPLQLSEAQAVTALNVDARFDAQLFTIEDVASPAGGVIAHRVDGDQLRLALASTGDLEGEVAVVRLRSNGADALPELSGKWSANEGESRELAAAAGTAALPETFALEQNYPNPFNPATTISYALPEDSHVRLVVMDALGREVASLIDEPTAAGIHEVTFDAKNLPSGIYFYRMEAGSFSTVRKMMLSK